MKGYLEISQIKIKKVYSIGKKRWTETLLLQGQSMNVKLHTTSEANILPYNFYTTLKNKSKFKKTDKLLVSYGKTRLNIFGVSKLNTKSRYIEKIIEYSVIKQDFEHILGLSTTVDVQLTSLK